MPKKKIVVYPYDSTSIMDAAERNVTRSITEAFEDAYEEIMGDVIEQYERQTTVGQIIEMLSFDSFDSVPDDIHNSLKAVFGESAENQIENVYIFVEDDVKKDDVFNLANEDAKDYAHERSAELVGKKWVNDKLVDNPDAKWAITDTTRDSLRSVIESAYADALTPAQLSKEIQLSYGFSKERAKMIAKTEMTKASTQGALAGWKRTGVVEGKEWIIGDDHEENADCDCADNADEGVIALDDTWSLGDDGPPNHPNCNCSMAATLSAEE